MKWTEITIKTTTEAVEAVTNILYEQNVGGVSIEDPKDFKFQKKNEYDWDFVDKNKEKYLSMDVDKIGRIDVEKGYPDHAVLRAKLKLHLPT